MSSLKRGPEPPFRYCRHRVKAKLKAGTPYWVTVTTEGADNTFAFWNFNSTDQIDTVPIANNTGSGWTFLGGTVPVPSFAVYGK